ncbi:MAG: hypothetical protein AAF495_20695 [Pseudomonadota bacterium]
MTVFGTLTHKACPTYALVAIGIAYGTGLYLAFTQTGRWADVPLPPLSWLVRMLLWINAPYVAFVALTLILELKIRHPSLRVWYLISVGTLLVITISTSSPMLATVLAEIGLDSARHLGQGKILVGIAPFYQFVTLGLLAAGGAGFAVFKRGVKQND